MSTKLLFRVMLNEFTGFQMHISKIIGPSKPHLGSDRQKVWKWSKMADIPYFKPFYSKCKADVEGYSNLSQPMVYLKFREMNFLGLKGIFRKLVGPRDPTGDR